MTAAQRKFFYFPAWNRCADVNGWIMRKGRLVANLIIQSSELMSEPAGSLRRRIIDHSTWLASQSHRSVIADDLRHACNWIASQGKTISSNGLNGKSITRSVRLFNLLSDPENLQAIMDWENPESADRRDYIDYLRKIADERALEAVARNAWDSADWTQANMDQLQWLGREVGRSATRKNYDEINSPF